MFKTDLASNLKNIFGVKKVTFHAQSDSFEQDTIFVSIDQCNAKASAGEFVSARVTGSMSVYSLADKMPFGFFAKKIEKASAEDKRGFIFFNIDENVESSPARLQDIYERRVSFVYLWQAQYDPNQGLITSIEIGDE